MTTPQHAGNAPGLVPPPACPAHADGGAHHLFGPDLDEEPSELYARLRAEHGQVAPVLLPGNLPAWLVLGYAENREVMHSPHRFSRDSGIWTMFKDGHVAKDSPIRPLIEPQPVCVFVDGEPHQRLRTAVVDSLGSLDRRGVRRYITRYTQQLVGGFAAAGRADLIDGFAERLPMLVLSKLFGLPEEVGPKLADAVLDLMKGTANAQASNLFIMECLQQLVATKQETGYANDFTAALIGHTSALTTDEVVEHLRLVLVAANEGTSNLIGNVLSVVLTDRRFRGHLSGGQMTLPDALEQVMWDMPPLPIVPGRWATTDTELGGRRIKAGDMLLLGLAAANTDPEIRPDLFDPVHGNRAHLAFSGGPHECPGADLGRAIADTGVDVLLGMLKDLQLQDGAQPVWRNEGFSRRVVSLPVQFAPGRPAATKEPARFTAARARTAAADTASQAPAGAPAASVAAPAAGVTGPSGSGGWWRSLLGK
ncbi:cytochrome P450 [Streptomyces pinistramenti]|uniref:cytochrome P450 n=1 Tax=Streptomyces pinistramenti TaxID=2884812 RepID=UPI001D073C04|nr:cytochrome P450 [Streptomyces pinistramenti]MCB5908044.1 cytochrome P450 [Streptomyces pinistramenti]